MKCPHGVEALPGGSWKHCQCCHWEFAEHQLYGLTVNPMFCVTCGGASGVPLKLPVREK